MIARLSDVVHTGNHMNQMQLLVYQNFSDTTNYREMRFVLRCDAFSNQHQPIFEVTCLIAIFQLVNQIVVGLRASYPKSFAARVQDVLGAVLSHGLIQEVEFVPAFSDLRRSPFIFRPGTVD